MPEGANNIRIRGDSNAIFELIHDYRRRLEWDPFLCRAELLDGATTAGLGVHAICVAKRPFGLLGMRTEYVAFNPPTLAAVKMITGPVFLNRFGATIRQETNADGTVTVTYRYSFTSRPVAIAAMIDPLAASFFSRETKGRLEALKLFVERTEAAS